MFQTFSGQSPGCSGISAAEETPGGVWGCGEEVLRIAGKSPAQFFPDYTLASRDEERKPLVLSSRLTVSLTPC